MSQFRLMPGSEDEITDSPPPRRPPRQPRQRRSRHSSRVAVIVSLAVVAALAVAAVVAVQSFLDQVGDAITSGPPDYTGPGTGTTVIVIDEGDSASDIGLTLADADVVASSEAFVAAAARDPASTGIQPGTYEMPTTVPAAEALEILVDPGNRIVDGVLVREGLRVEQTLGAYEDQAGMPRDELDAAAAQPEAIGLPPEAEGDPEGFLFPATYEVTPSTTPVDALGAMTAKYAEVAADLDLGGGAEALGYTPREIVTIASMVQAEARLEEDFAKIARVVYNRLDDGQPLQMDSTVAFANDVYTVFTTDEQRAIDSPYNTYTNPGLPPGPINSPGELALQAALNPADGPWRYFATVNLDTGETRYSETFEDHQRNVAELEAWIEENQA